MNYTIRDENGKYLDEVPPKTWRSRAGILLLAVLALALVVWVMDMTLNLL